jgi:SAM-dependent methyltransferase
MSLSVDRQLEKLRASIEGYYTEKVSKHGPTPRGADWTCVATQELRFVQLLKICDFAVPFSLNDVGCGYGALIAYLAKRHQNSNLDYLGIDLSPAMIHNAERLWKHWGRANFVIASTSPRIADYSIASGIFNVKLNQPQDLWEHFIASALIDMNATSRRGFAFNLMASQSIEDSGGEELYCTVPDRWVLYCEQEFRCSVEVITGYGMGEFTLLARRPIPIS